MLMTRLTPHPASGQGQANRADDQTEPILLSREDMLDGDPGPRPAGVAADDVRRRRLTAWLCPLELRSSHDAPAALRSPRTIGGIGPDGLGGVLGVELLAELAAGWPEPLPPDPSLW